CLVLKDGKAECRLKGFLAIARLDDDKAGVVHYVAAELVPAFDEQSL
ncbi:MAG: hypothetical protein H0X53_08435, partial [Sphingomonas sp.]|nr:hypothetical protein [Sphingomonas sp.]